MDMLAEQAKFETRRKKAQDFLLSVDLSDDLYAGASVFSLIHGARREAAEAQLKFTAEWFEHPHPHGRDHRGEADFAAISMVPALFRCYDDLSQACRDALDTFFLARDYRSMHGSENHALMARVARLLAAEFYRGRQFSQYGKTAEELHAEDEGYIDDFLMYRAGRAWGEFDSLGYNAEDICILNSLYTFTSSQRLRKKAGMMIDLLLLDMLLDSKAGIYGGAHGRSYPEAVLDSTFASMVTHGKSHIYHSTMYAYWCYYFGAEAGYPEQLVYHPASLLSDYFPSEAVFRIARERKLPYSHRERKHLHVMTAWMGDRIHRKELALVEELSIDKRIYVCEDYMLGGITHQDAYPEELVCAWYAHHQQHEWELTLPGDGRAKIFTHHPGDPGQYKIHNQWTGDSFCNCGTHFCTDDTAIHMYNIRKEAEYPFINADIPLEFFPERRECGNYLFLRHGRLGIMLWFSNGYRFVTEGPTAGFEAISDGRQHAVICHVEYLEKYGSLDAFAAAMQALPIAFDRENMSVEFLDIRMDYENRWVKGELQTFPYQKLYESPYLNAEYGSGILEITVGDFREVMDFNF